MLAALQPNFTIPGKTVLTNQEYHANPAVGSSSLKNVLRSPAHYKHKCDNPEDPTPAMELGTAIHEAILEPNLFADAVVMPTFSGTGSRAAKDQWLLENHGKRILTADNMERIKGILKSVSAHKTARSLLSKGASEESYFATCPDTGIICKARPDFLRDGHIIVDVKSTVDASPAGFAKAVANYHYALSGAFYLDVVSNVMGQNFNQFIILAVEKEPPYAVGVYLLDEGTIDAGRFLYKKALKRLKACRDSGVFPAYADEVQSIALPTWAWPEEEF